MSVSLTVFADHIEETVSHQFGREGQLIVTSRFEYFEQGNYVFALTVHHLAGSDKYQEVAEKLAVNNG